MVLCRDIQKYTCPMSSPSSARWRAVSWRRELPWYRLGQPFRPRDIFVGSAQLVQPFCCFCCCFNFYVLYLQLFIYVKRTKFLVCLLNCGCFLVTIYIIFLVNFFTSVLLRSMCAVPSVAVFCSSWFRAFPVRCAGIFWMTSRWFQLSLLFTSILLSVVQYRSPNAVVAWVTKTLCLRNKQKKPTYNYVSIFVFCNCFTLIVFCCFFL